MAKAKTLIPIFRLKLCICSIGSKQPKYKIKLGTVISIVILVALLIWGGYGGDGFWSGKLLGALIVGVIVYVLILVFAFREYHRKGHSIVCSAYQSVFEIIIDSTSPESEPEPRENPELVSRAAAVGSRKAGYRFYAQPLAVFAWRLMPSELLGLCLGVLIVLWPFNHYNIEPNLMEWLGVIISGLVFASVPFLLVRYYRPYVVADKTGIDVVVDQFFAIPAIRNLFAFRGFGDETLNYAIDFMTPWSMDWNEVNTFSVEKRYLLYHVWASIGQRKRVHLAVRFSRNSARNIITELKRLQAHELG